MKPGQIKITHYRRGLRPVVKYVEPMVAADETKVTDEPEKKGRSGASKVA